VRLHPEVPLLCPSGLVHLRIALLLSVLGRSRCVQDGRVHDRAGRDSPLGLAGAGSASPGSVPPVGVLPASAGIAHRGLVSPIAARSYKGVSAVSE
jgi:hypothetical protein